MTFNFLGKRVVVAGGSRGIGRSIALGFAAAGADVSICARGAQALEATRADLAQHGHRVHAAACDLADAKDVAAYVVVLLMLVFKPNGLFGEKLRKKV